MRLKKVKLAGFKSFVDPTTISFLSNLTAVVGPNGCGKSNVIDAVRWVMGESSAKYLRGGELTDVIFSGSSARNPVGRATVELFFDNAEGKLGGEYASYAEISIKRQVTREGQSTYFLNGQRCRRRDIMDIFLGTGLGPRSYAIIEQGMISRIIESKPEDIRTFIEEAAGISKYKERRRETENRIQHTQDNLARLNDLREELGNQLRHLQRQSQAAQRYKELKAQSESLSLQLAALGWQKLNDEIQVQEGHLRVKLNELEAGLTEHQHLKTQSEKERVLQSQARQSLEEVQKHYYNLGAEVAKNEQALAHHHERLLQLQDDQKEAKESYQTRLEDLALAQDQQGTLETQIEDAALLHQEALEKAQETFLIQQEREEQLELWREEMSALQESAFTPSREAEAHKAKIDQLERQIHQTQVRYQRLAEENEKLIENEPQQRLEQETLAEKIVTSQMTLDDTLVLLEKLNEEKKALLQTLTQERQQLQEAHHTLNEIKGKHSVLLALQRAAFGENEEEKQTWLAEKGVKESSLVVQKLKVTPGWEGALESVLKEFLKAVSVEKDEWITLTQDIPALKEKGVSLLKWQMGATSAEPLPGRLVNYLQNASCLPAGLNHLLSSVHTCPNWEAALALVEDLPVGESVITPEGIWMGAGWLKVIALNAELELGLLEREEKIRELTAQMTREEENVGRLQKECDEKEQLLKEVEGKKEEIQKEHTQHQHALMSLQTEQRIYQNRLEQQQKRLVQVQQELTECQEWMHTAQQEVNVARVGLQEALDKMEEINTAQQTLLEQKENLQSEVSASRLCAKEAKEKVHQVALTLQTYRTQLEGLGANIERFKEQIEQAKAKIESTEELLIKHQDPIPLLQAELQVSLEKRLGVEKELNQTRDQVALIENNLREIENQSNEIEKKINILREQSEQIKMNWQALSVRRETTAEKLKDQSLEEILKTLPEDAEEEKWQQTLEETEQKIQRLGAINLAAIEEHDAALERKTYLDTQYTDLTEALMTLETAIKKIDKETRTKFKETFDKINHHFMELFPRLFGGGQASLALTGEDLLDTGVSLIARPPGKKNSTIQQLSGGEKALTAVALVFSIFELNPAPFCMLDEVDAPLDDSNVGRFCNLVKDMAKSVQFIYVSHNKLAIEMAEQLQGVTMREPGVSRLVTVDIEEAKSLAQA